jgi:hypothetical protein
MDILIGTWRTFVLCTTHSAQSKNHDASEKINSAQSGIHLLDDGASMRIRGRESHQSGERTPCDGAFFGETGEQEARFEKETRSNNETSEIKIETPPARSRAARLTAGIDD